MSDSPRAEWTIAQCAYLAGIVDGEGYIGLCKTGADRYLLRVAVTSTTPELITWIGNATKIGKFYFRKGASHKRQNSYERKVFGNEAAEFLRLVLPYMVVKSAQATLAIKYQDDRVLSGEARKAFGAHCYERLKQLNSRQRWKATVAVDGASPILTRSPDAGG